MEGNACDIVLKKREMYIGREKQGEREREREREAEKQKETEQQREREREERLRRVKIKRENNCEIPVACVLITRRKRGRCHLRLLFGLCFLFSIFFSVECVRLISSLCGADALVYS